MRSFTRLVLAACCALAWSAHGQDYPTKSIRLIVPFAPGGGTDLIGRIVAQQMSEALGHQFVVDNRGGAGSVLGSDLASKAAPDGYTLLLGNISLAFNASLYRKLPFDAVRDFAPVTLVAVQPNILVIHPGLPAKTLNDFVALARSQPGKLTYASAGTGSGTHLAMELLKLQLKLDIVHVPYKGTGPALTDVIGGQVSSMLSTFASALPHVKTGRLRALGVTSKTRSRATPDVPTLIEAGVPDYDYTTWYGLLAPRGTPAAVVNKLAKTAGTILVSEDAKRKFEAQGVDPLVDTPAEFAAYLKSDIIKWARVVKEAKIPQQ
jgi:tripartite-type tricarboxylate transporter receptor subunit TctC